MIEVFYNPNLSTLKEKYCDALDKALSEMSKDNNVLLMLSGGSALKAISNFKPKALSPKITITVLDERYTFDESLSNYRQLEKTIFFQEAKSKGCKTINPAPEQGESQEATARRFQIKIKEWLENNKNGKILATQGIGKDGHTAGIFRISELDEPLKKRFYDKNNFIISYSAKGNDIIVPQRITVNFAFLQIIDKSLVFAVGEDKKEILEKILCDNPNLEEYPASVIHKIKNVIIFTDQKLKINN